MTSMGKKGILALAAACCLGACQTNLTETKAVLASDDIETIAAVKNVLARAMGRSNIELGAGDPTKRSSISVLPPRPGPREGRSTAMPEVFDIMLRGSVCYLVRRSTGDAFIMEEVRCLPLDA